MHKITGLLPEDGPRSNYGPCPNERLLPKHGSRPKKQPKTTMCELLYYFTFSTDTDNAFYVERLQKFSTSSILAAKTAALQINFVSLSSLTALSKSLSHCSSFFFTSRSSLNLNNKFNSTNVDSLIFNSTKCIDLYTEYVDLNTECFNFNAICIDSKYKLNFRKSINRNINNSTNSALSRPKKDTFKDLQHRINYCELNLSGDIEVNPGPAFVDPAKTIHAPYCQGDVSVFGENAGRQCVAMSLCSLIYTHSNGSIPDSTALINIMKFGDELYSILSSLSKQRYLLLTELPTMLTLGDTNYSLELSESYSGNLHLDAVNENIPFVMPINAALEQLGQEQFNSFLLTIELNTVAIFIENNNLFKVFDSHARDLYGMPHPCGSCVLLKFDSIWKLTEYFKFLYAPGAIFELKVVKIINIECNEQLQNVNSNEVITDATTISNDTSLNCTSAAADDISSHICTLYTQECSVYIYAICFSTIMTCSY
ncbi:ATP-dependent DNA helicase PIF1 [Paramuricea clavata]|uniref:ATP-dependent DNA helicase PIF1 n=1 Tax=Paramuricea clavata TaxID=317549 RepID=A0A7D9DWF1_PARCT|nr:ATP-dependent DNA helicase PIF1 [Paramuricea clavata]